MKKSFVVILISALLFTVVSCGSSKVEVKDDGWVSFTIDNPDRCGYFYTTGQLGTYDMLEAEFKKDSGYEDSCYGFVFGYSSQKAGIVPDYIRFEINTLGEYAVYTYDGKTYKDLVDDSAKNTAYLVETSAVKKGFGEVNKLKVEKAADGTYSCFINGMKVVSGIAPLENGTDGMMCFYSVGKSAQENFPDTPVAISYRVTNFKLATSNANAK